MITNVTEWLDMAAQKYPSKNALIDATAAYTFAEVQRRARKIAAELISKKIRRQPVAVYMEKSADMLIAYFGVAYSGYFYSPISTNMPASRTEKILNTLEPAAVIRNKEMSGTNEETEEIIASIPCQILYEEAQDRPVSAEDLREIDRARAGTIDTDLLYVLFTSGSTGNPKGVGISHRSVIDYIDCITETFHITQEDSFANQAPFYFDNSILDIYCTLRTGATLHIVPETLFSQPVKLLEYLRDHRITTIFWVPSALTVPAKLRAFEEVPLQGILKRVLFCGEVMPVKYLNVWRKYLPDVLYANLYGPTEITDACTCYIVDREFDDTDSLPIGKPMRNTDILVLNDKDQPVGQGEKGELCVRGTGLSVGYYQCPEKTREAFVQNPLNPYYPEMIYRTGDVVYYNDRGELIYVCRKDNQIKHMGFRIELGEIETAAASLSGIDNCCCLYDSRRSRIVLFTETHEEALTDKSILNELGGMLPRYMLPGRICRLDHFPYNLNGKIDRVKLKESYFGSRA